MGCLHEFSPYLMHSRGLGGLDLLYHRERGHALEQCVHLERYLMRNTHQEKSSSNRTDHLASIFCHTQGIKVVESESLICLEVPSSCLLEEPIMSLEEVIRKAP